MKLTTGLILKAGLVIIMALSVIAPSHARRVAGGGHVSVHGGGHYHGGGGRNINHNVNRNYNRNVNVNVNGRGGCCYYHNYPVARAAAVTTAVVGTAAVIGSIVNTIPPSCSTVIVNGLSYSQCGSTWYQPQISGSSTTYVVVNNPN